MYIRGGSDDACSIFATAPTDPEGPTGSSYTRPTTVLETGADQWRARETTMNLTFGEKLKSLIIRFLLHRSS